MGHGTRLNAFGYNHNHRVAPETGTATSTQTQPKVEGLIPAALDLQRTKGRINLGSKHFFGIIFGSNIEDILSLPKVEISSL